MLSVSSTYSDRFGIAIDWLWYSGSVRQNNTQAMTDIPSCQTPTFIGCRSGILCFYGSDEAYRRAGVGRGRCKTSANATDAASWDSNVAVGVRSRVAALPDGEGSLVSASGLETGSRRVPLPCGVHRRNAEPFAAPAQKKWNFFFCK